MDLNFRLLVDAFWCTIGILHHIIFVVFFLVYASLLLIVVSAIVMIGLLVESVQQLMHKDEATDE